MATIEELNRQQLRAIVGFAADTLLQAKDFAIANGFMSEADVLAEMIVWSKIVGQPLSTDTIPPAPDTATAAPAIATPIATPDLDKSPNQANIDEGSATPAIAAPAREVEEISPADVGNIEDVVFAPAPSHGTDVPAQGTKRVRKRSPRGVRNTVTAPVPPLETVNDGVVVGLEESSNEEASNLAAQTR